MVSPFVSVRKPSGALQRYLELMLIVSDEDPFLGAIDAPTADDVKLHRIPVADEVGVGVKVALDQHNRHSDGAALMRAILCHVRLLVLPQAPRWALVVKP